MNSISIQSINAIAYSRFLKEQEGLRDIYGYCVPSTELIVSVPTECPCCNKVLSNVLSPILSVNNINWYTEENEKEKLCDTISVYRCNSCGKLFMVSDNHRLYEENGENMDEYNLEYIYPINDKITVFSDEIKKLSMDFVTNYNDAEKVESQNLIDFAGMGYRRALEFLVDAYVKEKNPGVTINSSMLLGNKIQTYIPEKSVKSLAEKAAWLGNDATHIVKKHPNRDISDMKKFIKAIVKYIEFEEAVRDADTIPKVK